MKRTALILLGALALVWPALAQGPVAVKRLTNVIDSYPQFSRDGKQRVFQSNRSGKMQIYVSKADGTEIRQLTQLDIPAQVPCWSPDGKQIVFAAEPGGDSEIFVMQADGSDVRRLTNIVGDDSHPHWSADGARILFNSARTTPDPKAD